MKTPLPLLPLKDLHLPPAISWWPLAPGWYALMGLLLIAVLSITLRLFYRYRQRRYWRLAKRQIEQLKQQDATAATVGDLAYLLKQIALIYFPDRQAAQLSGQQWLRFLDSTTAFSGFVERGQVLIDYAYQPPLNPVNQLPSLLELSDQWLDSLKKHPVPKRRL